MCLVVVTAVVGGAVFFIYKKYGKYKKDDAYTPLNADT